jgi:uncharacterized membrane protein
MMIIGALLGGPIVDFIRRDIGKTQFEYLHTNIYSGKVEKRIMEISAWRTIAFFGFILCFLMVVLLSLYNSKAEETFKEKEKEDQEKISCWNVIGEILNDFKFWRFMLFSFVIVGAKMSFSLLFFMIPKMITQADGENAPFGIYVAVAPLLIILFLLFLAPV